MTIVIIVIIIIKGKNGAENYFFVILLFLSLILDLMMTDESGINEDEVDPLISL